MMTENPWEGLGRPSAEGEYSARLVSEDINPSGVQIYWAISWYMRPSLIVDYACEPWRSVKIPSFMNIRVTDHRESKSIVIELLDLELTKKFLVVCNDVIATLQGVPLSSRRESCLRNLGGWGLFLQMSKARLSQSQQKGLIAELLFLDREAIPALGIDSALQGWVGPDEAPRDFSYGQTFIEVKSKRSSSSTTVRISSEHQLNAGPNEQLFLYVVELNDAVMNQTDSISLPEIVGKINAYLSPLQRVNFGSKLAKVGYLDEPDFRYDRWSEGASYFYCVVDGFPKIDSYLCPLGVQKVGYDIDLNYCEHFKIGRHVLLAALEGLNGRD